MTNQAIILSNSSVNNNCSTPLLEQNINGKTNLHYQLEFLSDNMIDKVIIVHTEDKEAYLKLFGEKYIDVEITYIPYNIDLKQSGNILAALEFITDPNVFVFNSRNYFRLNLSKADNFRRMRESKILLIGKKEEGSNLVSEKLFLNEKGKILKIFNHTDTDEKDTINTETYLINKKKFIELFENKKESVFEFIKNSHLSNPMFCLSCRQYFKTIKEEEDIQKLANDLTENYF